MFYIETRTSKELADNLMEGNNFDFESYDFIEEFALMDTIIFVDAIKEVLIIQKKMIEEEPSDIDYILELFNNAIEKLKICSYLFAFHFKEMSKIEFEVTDELKKKSFYASWEMANKAIKYDMNHSTVEFVSDIENTMRKLTGGKF